MASVVNSARSSTASVFDLFGTTADAANQFVRTAARSISALDAKVDLMHESVVSNTTAQKKNVRNHAIIDAALQHVERMEEVHNRIGIPFDRISTYNSAIEDITAAFATKE